MSALRWQNEPPDKPGWWWFNADRGPHPVLVMPADMYFNETVPDRTGLVAVTEFDSDGTPNSAFVVGKRRENSRIWAGPIPEPQEAALMAAEGGA